MESGDRGPEGAASKRPPVRSFRDLEVYQRAFALVKPIQDLVKMFPERERHRLSDQMLRASASIPANIAEGFARRGSLPVFKNHLSMAMGSANEMEAHLDIALTLGYLTPEQHRRFIDEYQIIGKQLRRMIQTWRTITPPLSTLHSPAAGEGDNR